MPSSFKGDGEFFEGSSAIPCKRKHAHVSHISQTQTCNQTVGAHCRYRRVRVLCCIVDLTSAFAGTFPGTMYTVGEERRPETANTPVEHQRRANKGITCAF